MNCGYLGCLTFTSILYIHSVEVQCSFLASCLARYGQISIFSSVPVLAALAGRQWCIPDLAPFWLRHCKGCCCRRLGILFVNYYARHLCASNPCLYISVGVHSCNRDSNPCLYTSMSAQSISGTCPYHLAWKPRVRIKPKTTTHCKFETLPLLMYSSYID